MYIIQHFVIFQASANLLVTTVELAIVKPLEDISAFEGEGATFKCKLNKANVKGTILKVTHSLVRLAFAANVCQRWSE